MTVELILVHGRSQQRKNADDLKASWLDSLRSGLRRHGLDLPVANTSIHFPYYGDTLDQLVKGVDLAAVADVVIRGTAEDEAAQSFLRALLQDVQEKEGVSDDQAIRAVSDEEATRVTERGIKNAKLVLGILRYLDENVPLASGPALALATNDVYHYLHNNRISDAIDGGVRAAFQSPHEDVRRVVVAHSLGSIVAYKLLHDSQAAAWNVTDFITVGSPLGVRAISSRLSALGVHGFPAAVARWYNALDPQDVVALRPLHDPWFESETPVVNFEDVVNPTSNQHGISGYLGNPTVAKRIHEALTRD